MLPLQVVSDYDSEMEMQSVLDGQAGARATFQGRAHRQRAWLKRGRETTASVLKHRKRHRRAASQWLMSLHNQAIRANCVYYVAVFLVSLIPHRLVCMAIWVPLFMQHGRYS